VLRFKRLPNPAVAQVIAAVEGDESFRKVLAARVGDADVDRAGHLWLNRPRNWEAELGTIVAAEDRRADALREIQVEHEAVKNISTMRESLRDASARIEELTAERKRLQSELDKERSERKALQGELTAAEADSMRARNGHKEAVRQLKTTEELLLRRNRDQEALVARIGELEAGDPEAAVDGDRIEAGLTEVERAAEAVRTAAQPIEAALGPLWESIDSLQQSLAALIEPATDTTEIPKPPVAAPRKRSRETLKLPPGILDDSLEAAEHLVAAPGAVLLVDGYNMTMDRWARLSIEAQRERLVNQLNTLGARTTLTIEVVFDGDDDAAVPTPGGRNLGLRVSFSPSGIEADDVIIERVRSLPAEVGVLVASDDRRVQTAVKISGANVLTARQLFGVMR